MNEMPHKADTRSVRDADPAGEYTTVSLGDGATLRIYDDGSMMLRAASWAHRDSTTGEFAIALTKEQVTRLDVALWEATTR